MSFFLKSKKLDIKTGAEPIALLHEEEAYHFGIRPGDKIQITWRGKHAVVEANTSLKKITQGNLGLYSNFWDKYPSLQDQEIVEINFVGRAESVNAIKKKIFGKKLTQADCNSIMKDIVENRLSNTQIAYFVAASYMRPFADEELYFMTKAMADNGDKLELDGMVADKHSFGGVAGNEAAMIVVPIVASLGIKIPKNSSRAITSVSGTADTMEVLCPVIHNIKKIKDIVKNTNGCIVWGGGLNIAPADDRIITTNYPMSLESFDKAVVSIMAKKIASSSNHIVIDLPVGETTKIPNIKDAKVIKEKFEYLAKRFKVKINVVINPVSDPIGKGMGPALEARDVLRVLQQKENRPGDLEIEGIKMTGHVLELCKKAKKGQGEGLAWKQLRNGEAWKKMQEIIEAQGGNPNIDSEDITIGAVKNYINASKNGKIVLVNQKAINDVCRTLGAPNDKLAGIYLNKEFGNRVKKGERLFTLYAENKDRMALALNAISKGLEIFTIK
ncbi:MAG: thymidine phosphorylase [Patescibacteria group bacterium]|nr:thymidine phosphorylase [Patescibacteria group bacterium]MDD4304877.1 thymidine phosphorylase [Patescibacteria group bacterium]MDD4695784.1 thymidine phosphorylase [Patescibacteria group bacterium]